MLTPKSPAEKESKMSRSLDTDCQYGIHRAIVLLVDQGNTTEAFRFLRLCLRASLPKKFRRHLMQITGVFLSPLPILP